MPATTVKKVPRSKKSGRNDSEEEPSSSLTTPSGIDTDIESEIDALEADVNHKIQSSQSVELRELQEFFSDTKMINNKSDPTTNIIDRHAGKCYNVPEKKIAKMFKLLEACRRNKQRLMFNERQQDMSGIMLDFDIYQDTEEDQITDEILYILTQKIIELITKIINFKDAKKETFYIGVTRRPKITFNEEKDCYKDGFHMIIPSIKVSRGVKCLLIKKIIESELLDQVMSTVIPADRKEKGEQYQHNHFIDKMSSSVPTFFIGSSTKKGHAPYVLTHIYEATVNFDSRSIMLIKNESLLKSKSFNVCHEFSLNYECTGGIIKKHNYEPIDKFVSEIQELDKISKEIEEVSKNYGELSTHAIHDAAVQEIRDLLDIISARAEPFEEWRDVLFALAHTSPSYKDLAEYFSRKSKKFNQVDFEKWWGLAIRGPNKNKKGFSLGSLHHWAKIDNPAKYDEFRKNTVHQVAYNMVYESYKEGILSHSDIAELVYKLQRHKYVTDRPKEGKKRVWYEFITDDDSHQDGELYKWRPWADEQPVGISLYISKTLPKLFEKVLSMVKKNYDNSSGDLSKYYRKVLENLKGTMRRLGDKSFKRNVIEEAALLFSVCGFADQLDTDPLIRGVQNGVLKLGGPGKAPVLIQGFHTYKISKYTDVAYEPFNPHDPITKKILITLRSMFPDNESDTFEYTMYFLASTLDGNPKESIFMLMNGKGANGKSSLVELHISAIGSTYGVKMNTAFLTSKSTSADTATPAIMQLKDATFAYYSETNKREVLNDARMKEITGQETLAGRRLNENIINFKPKCHHLVLSNNDFDIMSHDHGTWRRVVYNPLKIKFVNPAEERFDPNDPYQRIADPDIQDTWPKMPEVRSRYLGFMVWMHFWLYQKYRGKVKNVPHPHIKLETEKYRRRQDVMTEFLTQRFVKMADPDEHVPLIDEIQKYVTWYAKTQGNVLAAKGITEQLQNSMIGKHIKQTKRGLFLIGHRFLDANEEKGEGEEFGIRDVYQLELEPNLDVITETPQQYYERICEEYEKHKHLFNGEAKYDVDATIEVTFKNQDEAENPIKFVKAKPRDDNVEEGNTRILANGIAVTAMADLPEPKTSTKSTNLYLDEHDGFMLDYSDDESEIDEDDLEEASKQVAQQVYKEIKKTIKKSQRAD